mmetsp:Transcript_4893/g.7795  ORF Transcript_4893/g.7795 Transcript_4893/m.7795 type:complete len:239 (-) Transcript_4893:236-952(-)|eukprot:CAMPEP_0175096696 /NCGR_PEP_ID=MMETSP0086_2-20121207/4875_1 /TAXON_ID=136419 /ORGANISM="Unknown Unknown, Strain D1" /LENGTH=238 /DNA_ID=CAMNT_0016370125 /DNA_START=150 /DNA_END=866 /DNA_ORIENTATION=+
MAPLSTNVFMGYTLLSGLAFLCMPGKQTLEVFPATQGDELATLVGTVYCEVIGAFSLMLCVNCCPGPMGYLLSAVVWCGVMSKHMLVNGLFPPPPVIAMGFGTLAICGYSVAANSKIGKWVFLLVQALNAFVFLSDPKTPLTDSFPDLKDGSLAMTVGIRCMEVVGAQMISFVLMGCPGALGRAMAMSSVAVLVAYHRTLDLGPPLPVLVMLVFTFLVQWYGYFTEPKSAPADSKKSQ